MPGSQLERRPYYPPVPVEQRKRRESEAIVPRAFRSARRNRHVSVPLAVPPALWLGAEAAHAFHAAGPLASASLVGTAAMWWLAPRKWERPPEVLYARLSCAAGCGWASLAAWLGPAGGDTRLLGVLLLAGGTAWGVPWWRHKRPRGQRRRQRMLARWDGWWQMHAAAWALSGSRVIEAAEAGVTIRLRVQLLAGRQSPEHVRSALKLIESGLDGMVKAGMVRVEVIKPSVVDLHIKLEDPLAREVAWDQSLAPRSVHEMAIDGLTETGRWKHTLMRVNVLVIGRTRSGKSNHLLVREAQLSNCPDDRQVLIDLKGGRSARPVLEAGCAEYVITGVDEARMYLRMITAEVEARAKHWYTGGEQAHATAEVPAVHTLIDEVRNLASATAGDDTCAALLATLASQGSGLELYVEVYTQYGSLDESVQTEQTRSNLTLRAVYAVEEARHGTFAIPDYVNHDASRLRQKGAHLLKDGPEALTEQVRAPKMEHDLFREVAGRNVRRLGRRRPLALYCGGEVAIPADGENGTPDVTWQEWWDGRWGRLDPAFRAISPQYREWADAQPGAATGTVAPEPVAAGAPPSRRVTPAAAEAAARIDADAAPYAGIEDEDLPRLKRGELDGYRAGQVERFCDALMASPGGISATQLRDECGRGLDWIYATLRALTDARALTVVRKGLWAVVPGVDIHQAMEAVEARNRQLKADAKARARRSRIHAA